MTRQSSRVASGALLLAAVAGGVWFRLRTEETSKKAVSSNGGASQAEPTPSTPPAPFDTRPTLAPSTAWSVDSSPPPEREFLEQLTALNATDKQAALTLAEQGERWYSAAGRFAEARRAMRVTLLVDLGRMTEARDFARDFIVLYPDSPYRRLVQGVTGIHPRPSGPRLQASSAPSTEP